MPVEIPIVDKFLDRLHGFDSKTVSAMTGLEKPHVRELLMPFGWGAIEIQRQRLIAQAAEQLLVASDATEFESLIEKEGFKSPDAYIWLTSGFEHPKSAKKIGAYGKGIFKNFLMPDAKGHNGEIYASEINGKTVIWFQGRAHPNEWEGERWGNIMLSHQYGVVIEQIRRKRINGDNPVIVTTYLAGSVGEEFNKGDLAIIGTETEENSGVAPGRGGQQVAEDMEGLRFQPKINRAATPEIAQIAMDIAKKQEIDSQVGVVAAIGTADTPQFQEYIEIQRAEDMLKRLIESGKFDLLLTLLLGKSDGIKRGIAYDMGIAFEMAKFRKLHPGEKDLNRIAIALISDRVNAEESAQTSHTGNVDVAKTTLERNMNFLTELLSTVFQSSIMRTADPTDFSIIHKLEQLPKEEQSELIDWLIKQYKKHSFS